MVPFVELLSDSLLNMQVDSCSQSENLFKNTSYALRKYSTLLWSLSIERLSEYRFCGKLLKSLTNAFGAQEK